MWIYRGLVSIWALIVLMRRGWACLGLPRPTSGQPSGPRIWLHGASNGELASVKPMLEALGSMRPDVHWLVTTNTETSRAMVAQWGLPQVEAHLAPVDLGWVTRRVMRLWQVAAHVTLEAEIWPHRVLGTSGPVLVLGARMSTGTARGWGRLPRLAHRVMSRLAFVSAQDAGSRDRLNGLGVRAAVRGPVVDLKAFYAPPDRPTGIDPALHDAFPRGHTWLAASTHDGEEALVLEAHKQLLRHDPQARLIIAPRHPRRADEIAGLASSAGLRMSRRSLGEGAQDGQIYLADTMGEMALWYSLAGRVLIGGTLCDRGGHTPYEPAAFGAALLHGPDVANFRAAFARLRATGAADEITTAAELAEALIARASSEAQIAAGQAAREALRPETDLDHLAQLVLVHLP